MSQSIECIKCGKKLPQAQFPHYFRQTTNGRMFICFKCIKDMPFASTIDYNRNLQNIPPVEIIRSIVRDKAIGRAINSLLLWGVINLVAWFFLGADMRMTLSKLSYHGSKFTVFIYGGAFIGGIMLLFGLFGAITRLSIVGWLDGLSLIGVGLWNLVHDFALIAALQPYGYTIKGSFAPWIILGTAQVGWGIKQLFRFSLFGLKPKAVDALKKSQGKERLQLLLKEPSDPEHGRLKFVITEKSYIFSTIFRDKQFNYTGWLLQDRVFCIADNISHFFEFNRREVAGAAYKKDHVKEFGIFRDITFYDEPSLNTFNEWTKIK